MICRKFAIPLSLLLTALTALGQPPALYPEKKGLVSDYAGKLTKPQIAELSGLIQRYEKRTSIEFAVVVVDDLRGQTPREYAIGVGDQWGVGKAGRDNGIVLLWAPNQRSYSLRIAQGLAADLNDADALRITQEQLLPDFKRGQYYAGLKDTLQATMAHLGDAAWDQRIQTRAQAAQQQREREAQQQERQRKEAAELTRNTIGFFLFMGLLVAIAVATYKWRHGSEERAELRGGGGTIADYLSKAEANAPRIRQILADFSKEAPEQDLKALRAEIEGQPDRIVKIRLDASLLDCNNLGSYDEMVRIRTAAEAEAGLLDRTQQQLDSVVEAKRASQALMDRLSREKFEVSGVVDSSRRSEVDQLLARSRQDYQQARQSSSMSLVDWLIISDLLNRSDTAVRQAVQYSREEPVDDTPSPISLFDSPSSDSGGSSSSGGGSFGGGGGFSGGSGSDGSY
ncbi:MAG TPA: TPM domain-containing protein [Candidatus Angelobacter sp.]|nr:TPM domain-containing protein [Candidatus Angelobacter sp.]